MRGSTLLTRLSLLVLVVSFVGCLGGGPKKPGWYLNPPNDPAYYVASAQHESVKERLAVTKAKEYCVADISRQIEVRVSNMRKQFEEEIGSGDSGEILESFTNVTKTVSKTTLRGIRTEQVETMENKNGSFTAYVLMLLPKAALAKEMENEAKKQEILYNRFRASQAYDELQKEMEEYDKSQGQ